MPVASPIGEVVHAALRTLDIAVQAVQLRVDATMIQFDVYAELVAGNTDFLRRFHYFVNVTFTDGTTGDNGLVVVGDITWPDEFVVFSDGTTGDNGLVVVLPIALDEGSVSFTETGYAQAYAIHNDEFASFADYAFSFILDFLRDEQVIFSDLSIDWQSLFAWDESVVINESMVSSGGNTIALAESVQISEVLLGANSIVLGEAVTLFEFWDTGLAFPNITEAVTWSDVLVVSVVAATDSRPGAFITGSALLGSPT